MSLVLNEEMSHALNAAAQAFEPMLWGLVKYSIPIAIVTFILGFIIAIFTALARISNSKLLRIPARVYVSIFRGTPMLVQMFIIFFGIPEIGRLVTGDPDQAFKLGSLTAAIISLSLNVGAYGSEIIRGGILSVPHGQTEAAYSIGMSPKKTMQRIILPQAIRTATPALGNTFLSLIKDTSLLGYILVAEMFRNAQQVASTTYEFLSIYTLVAIMYWVVCFIVSIIQSIYEARVERKYQR
ncbi:amino acid ABC transporter permease [Macrococcoides bohemicum]|uniref:Amino acid ABC transporter permease n=1 Tax=Macrococcoides bohemicum TaxID=1903056 RepID=A0A4R5Y850_9STAP|nr:MULTISPECIES: amino acid ABC transporter permease [Macrococcus]ATD29969.1 amino acid ABC transporter permease [Macrococcus sp. IME1552]QRN50334.1 amino acid ABC transporter permease [Macrococcus bohemicus]QYA43601.1 amino acid ABC transporter permease [Macrococcus bohemicus]QYA44179.1 amino acid ABC transporter permease [Macrococcus bohemicus]TDL40910.1 amino acid ABC transporter permease [Macrococcus bohemicus]